MRGFTRSCLVGGMVAIFVTSTMYGAAATLSRFGSRPRLATTPAESVLYGFVGGGEYGAFPYGGVVVDESGNLYGTTTQGGLYNGGVVFKLTPTASGYAITVLHNFQGGTDGFHPNGGVIDRNGALYGTTVYGGRNNLGTAFKLTPTASGYTESILHSFSGGTTDGQYPFAGLIADKNGTLYGTTGYGGSFGYCVPNTNCGSVYKLTPKGMGYAESILHLFAGGSDGADPFDSLVMDSNGVLYGTTEGGGSYGFGTVFSITPQGGTYGILYSFTGGIDGAYPYAAVIVGPGGTLYGTNTQSTTGTPGSVFRLTPTGSGGYTLTTLFTFRGGTTGSGPYTNVTLGANGQIYGTTSSGGSTVGCELGCGTVFRLDPTGMTYTETILYQFLGGNTDGVGPIGNTITIKGWLYGTTEQGWTNGEGTAYRVRL